MILYYSGKGSVVDTSVYTPNRGFDNDGTTLDEAGSHTIVFTNADPAVKPIVWSWTTEAYREVAFLGIMDGINSEYITASVDAEGTVTETVSS